MSRRLSKDDLALVVKRAAELHVAEGEPLEATLDEATALEVLREAGLSQDAATQALSEWRRGRLSHTVELPNPVPRTTLEPTAAVARRMPISAERLSDVFDAAMRRQSFTRGRRSGLGGDWVPKQGLWADLRRRLDLNGTLLLKDINRIRLEVQPDSEGSSRVTVTADVSSYRNFLVGGLVGIPALVAVGLGLGGIAEGSLELGLIGTPLAGLVAGGGYRGSTHLLEARREATREKLDILLDRLTA
jgi:hypothetical protein